MCVRTGRPHPSACRRAFRPRFDGTGQIHGDLDAIAFTDIASRVEGLADQLPSPPDRPDEARWRTRGHRQALALHALVTRDGPDRPGSSARMLVTLDPDRDTGVLHHRRGQRAISAAQLARLLALSEIRTILTSGGDPAQGRTHPPLRHPSATRRRIRTVGQLRLARLRGATPGL